MTREEFIQSIPSTQNFIRLAFKMAENHHHPSPVLFQPPESLKNESHVKSMDQYREMYQRSVDDPEGFWSDIAKEFHWESPPTGKFLEYNFDVRNGPIFIKWMQGAKTNVCYNAVDRHVRNGLGDKIAFLWYARLKLLLCSYLYIK